MTLIEFLEGKNYKLFFDNLFIMKSSDTVEVKEKLVTMPRPTALTEYNSNMNNVDKFD